MSEKTFEKLENLSEQQIDSLKEIVRYVLPEENLDKIEFFIKIQELNDKDKNAQEEEIKSE